MNGCKGLPPPPVEESLHRWRMETFFGEQAAGLDARAFFRLLWRERARLRRFLRWADKRRREQRARR